MTIDQRAALLDQLKRPIEEAPRDGTYVIGIDELLGARPVFWHIPAMIWMDMNRFEVDPTHFLPLPKPGPVEFEVVPSAIEQFRREEEAYLAGLETGAEVQRLEGEAE